MTNQGELSEPEIYDCAAVLISFRDLIIEAYNGWLPPSNRVNTLIELGGIVNADGTICKRFREVCGEVIGNREFEHIVSPDFLRIAARCHEWRSLPLGRLWSTEAYKSRSSPP
jgi:hypothetical protein